MSKKEYVKLVVRFPLDMSFKTDDAIEAVVGESAGGAGSDGCERDLQWMLEPLHAAHAAAKLKDIFPNILAEVTDD